MIIPSGYAQFNLLFSGPSLPTGAQCTFAADVSAGPSTPTAAGSEVATILEGLTDLIAATWTDVDIDGILTKFGPNATGPSSVVPSTWSGGYSSGDVLPATSYLIRKNTAMGGRQGRGRMYWPGVPNSEVDNAGNVSSGVLTDLSVAFTELYTEMAAADMPLVLLRAAGSPVTEPEPLTGLSPQSVVATQRRRQRR